MNKGKNWIFAALTLGGGFLGGVVAMQLAPSVADAAHIAGTIRAQRFVLVDHEGKTRASTSVTPDGATEFAMYDGAGHDRTDLRVSRDGVATVGFYNETGALRVLIGEVHGGRSGITVYGGGDKMMAGLTVGANNEASLTLYDANTGRARAGLGVAANGTPALALFDEKGNDRAELHVSAHGKPGLALADEAGKSIAGLPAEPSPQQ